jgi:two-component system, chemotaxis family, chemotaxis protein CheY
MKILVADDSRVMRSIVIRTLRQAGYGDADVVQAENGANALQVIADEDPDLVLSDWNMPVLDGLGLLKAMRANGDQRPFGFVTAQQSPQMRALAEQAGALFLIAKPFTPEDFRDAIDAAGR